MYKVKRRFLLLSVYACLILAFVYFYTTARSMSNAFHINVVGNVYISVKEEFAIEFVNSTTLKRITEEAVEMYEYEKKDGIYEIQAEETLIGIALNRGNEFYIETTHTYMILVS